MKIIFFLRRILSKKAAHFTLMVLFSFGLFLSLAPSDASAVTRPYLPNAGTLPSGAQNHFNICYGPNTPAVGNWVSPNNSQGSTSVTVPYGTTSLALDLWLAGVVCTNNSQVSQIRSYVSAVAPVGFTGSVSGLSYGTSRALDFNSHPDSTWVNGYMNVPRTYRHAKNDFTLNYPSGFKSNRTYTLNITTKNVNLFPFNTYPNRYVCVHPTIKKGITDYNAWAQCPSYTAQFSIVVNVEPPPTSREPIGTAKAECSADGNSIRIFGTVSDPDHPTWSIYTSFRINDLNGRLVDGPTKRGPAFSFYTSDSVLMDGNPHKLRMMTYDENDPNKNWYTNEYGTVNMDLIDTPVCEPPPPTSREPIGTAKAECSADGNSIRIFGTVSDPDHPTWSIYTSFRINDLNGRLVDGPTKRGPAFSFYTSDSVLMDGNPHKLRMMTYDENDPNKNWYTNEYGTVNMDLIDTPVCEPPFNNSTCTAFKGSEFGLSDADTNKSVVAVTDDSGQSLPNNNVQPGQALRFGVSLKNTNTKSTQWQSSTHMLKMKGPGGSSFKDLNTGDGRWNIYNGSNGRLLTLDANSIPSGGTERFVFGADVPTSASGTVQFVFRMVQDGAGSQGTAIGEFGASCSITLKVPENRPFLTTGGGDVFSGASFAANWLGPTDRCEPSVDSKKANVQTNGYYTDGNPKGARDNGSSTSQYATFASGLIGDDDNYGNINTFLGNYGYARSSIGDTKDALFANYHNGGDYGKFYNQTPMPCVDITKVQQSSEGVLSPGAVQSFMQSGKGVRTVGGDVSFSSAIIDANGHDKTIIVNGTVTLNGDITYASSFADATKIPHLKIIAHNIYIPSGTQQIDADLVASPTQGWGADQINGTIDTCSDVIGTGAGTWFNIFSKPTVNSCNTGVRFGGSLAARKVFWKRTYGTLGVKNDVADPTCYFGSYSPGDDAPIIQGNAAQKAQLVEQRYKKCAAESIDSNPQSMINFLNNNEQNKNVPTSTVELPPVY